MWGCTAFLLTPRVIVPAKRPALGRGLCSEHGEHKPAPLGCEGRGREHRRDRCSVSADFAERARNLMQMAHVSAPTPFGCEFRQAIVELVQPW